LYEVKLQETENNSAAYRGKRYDTKDAELA
jgi:hypothetical protein